MIIWHNGVFKNQSDFSFSIKDRVRYGDGVFDTMLAVDGHLIAADDHIARLYDHAHKMLIPVPYAEEDLIAAARDVLNGNALKSGQAVVNTILSRGVAPRGLMPPDVCEPEMVIMASAAPTEFLPVHALLAKTVRRNEGSPLSTMKSFQYGDSILALLEAKEQNANEAIFLNNRGQIACASNANIYAVLDGHLWTPPLSDGAMDGIVRRKLIADGIAQERSILPSDLEKAEGLFLSNSVRGLFPVEILDGKTLPLAKSPLEPHFHTKITF